jgi:two-component system chemotaxis response regulator CheB
MEPFKVLIVDDSALFRTLLRNVLHTIPGCEVAGTAADGPAALEKIVELRPDLVTLDVEMPGMNGIAVLQELRRRHLSTTVVMVSRLTSADAQVTTDALLQGAFDFVLKPSSKNASANRAELQAALSEIIAALRGARADAAPPAAKSPAKAGVKIARRADLQAVVIGCSTGGPDALAQVIPFLQPDFALPIVIVQHMPDGFTRTLAQRLNEASEVQVVEAADGLRLDAGAAILARGGRHLGLERISPSQVVVRFSDAPPEHNCRPAVDFTLRSAVEAFGGHVLAVILTGMGRDGLEGCRLIKEQGGAVLAQAAEGCVVYGMPKAVIAAGLADEIVPLAMLCRSLEALAPI